MSESFSGEGGSKATHEGGLRERKEPVLSDEMPSTSTLSEGGETKEYISLMQKDKVTSVTKQAERINAAIHDEKSAGDLTEEVKKVAEKSLEPSFDINSKTGAIEGQKLSLEQSDSYPDEQEKGLFQSLLALPVWQKALVVASGLIACFASAEIYYVPAQVMDELFSFGERAPVRMMDILHWNRVLVVFPVVATWLILMLNFRSKYLGIKLFFGSLAAGVLLISVSIAFSCFVMAVAA